MNAQAEPSTFLEQYLALVSASISNKYEDNYDHWRFGELPPERRELSAKGIVRDLLRRRGYAPFHQTSNLCLDPLRYVAADAHRFQWLSSLLADDESRSLLVQILAYRALGRRKVKLPLNRPDFWQERRRVERLADPNDFMQTDFLDWRLFRIDLEALGYPISLYGRPAAAHNQFVLQQYRCDSDDVIQVEEGDYVIDGGGCYGDTALYFSHKVGEDGRVFSFEFIPSNLNVLRRNLELNPSHGLNVSIVQHALWNESDLPVYFSDQGPASAVSLEESNDSDGKTSTLTIDDFVERYQIPQVDFIKLDIEGAETHALQGAVQTIRRFRPKLAIAIYHRLEDFVEIPSLLAGLDVGYAFYIRHFTIHAEETVLFAKTQQL